MKRNSIFMWAYISFIVIAIILRLFCDFSLWNPIVIAVCISSVFFALEDMFISFHNTTKDSYEILCSFIVKENKNLRADYNFLTQVEKAYNKYKDTIFDVSTVYDALVPVKQSRDSVSEAIRSMEKEEKTLEKRLKIFSRIANVFAYIGFLVLFCSLVFISYVTIPKIIQEILTVLPFAIILTTRQINELFDAKTSKERSDSQKALNVHIEHRNELDKVSERFNLLMEKIKEREEESEVAASAD